MGRNTKRNFKGKKRGREGGRNEWCRKFVNTIRADKYTHKKYIEKKATEEKWGKAREIYTYKIHKQTTKKMKSKGGRTKTYHAHKCMYT